MLLLFQLLLRSPAQRSAALGQYEYDEENGLYVQKSTEQSNEHYHERYIYYVDEHDVWMAGLPPGDETSDSL